jgi:hypothetical protein
MTACSTDTCGVGGWGGPLPGDPDNNSVLSATPAFGGIDVAWSYPAVNPFAVAHTLLYRAVANNFDLALQIGVVSGSQYYDKTENNQLIQYFYWIKIVSVNGTVGELIGPVSATAKPTINSMLDLLSGKIDAGLLAQSLRTEIDRIQLVSAELQTEIDNRDVNNAATTQLLAEMQAEINASLGIISDEITDRQEGESALLAEVNAVSAAIALEVTTRASEIQNEAGVRATALLNETSARIASLNSLQTQINTLQAASSGDFSELLSVLQEEQIARIDGDAAEATSRETLAVQMRGNYLGNNSAELSTGLLYSESQARIAADSSIVSSVSALSATVNTNAAALTTEATTRASADNALSNSITTLSAQVNNTTTGLPATRASLLNNYYTKATVDSSIASAVLNLVSTTGLATTLESYPTTASLTQNYYTKTATDAAISAATTTLNSSFNTALGLYTPTATLTDNYYTKTATDLAISSASTTLTSAFDVKLGLYTPTATLSNLYYTKTQADSAIATATQNLVSTTALNTALTGYSTTAVLNTNYYTKTGADAAISAATQNLVSTTALNSALSSYPTTATLTTNYYTKTAVDSAISSATQNLVSSTGLATTLAAYPTTATLTNNYFTQTQTNSAISLATQNLVSNTGLATTLGGYVTNAALTTNHYTKTQTDSAISSATSTLVSNAGLNTALGAYTSTASLQTDYFTKTQTNSAISTAITTSQTTLNGNIASAQTTLQTNINTVDGKVTAIGARYTAVVSANGLVGGFGIYNTGTTIQAGFDVNEFWVGSSQANKRKPFIITDGVTYIDDAAINKLTFSKLRDDTGAVIIENGKIKANYLNVDYVNAFGVEIGKDVGPGAGHYGLSLSSDNFNDIFIKRSDGVRFFRVNSGGANSIEFDSSSGNLNITASVTARSFSTIGGRFTADASGNVIADLIDIRRRTVLESGTLDPTDTVVGYTTTTYTSSKGSGTDYSYFSPGTVIRGKVRQIVYTNIYDFNTQSSFANQPYYVAAHFNGPQFRNWSGSNGSTFELHLTGVAASIRTYSNVGAFANNARVAIVFEYAVKLVSGSFRSFRLPTAQWTIYKL